MLLWILSIFVFSLALILLTFIEDKLLSGYYNKNNKEKQKRATESLILFMDKHNLKEVEVVYVEDEHSDFYISKKNQIVINQKRKNQGKVIDHYVVIHEAFHALQKKEQHKPSLWRYDWGEKHKLKHAVAFILLFAYTAVLNLFDESVLWNVLIASYFISIYLINNIPTLISEVNAALRTYNYLLKELELSKKERRMLKFRIFIAIRDYIILSPYSIFI